MVIEFKFYVRNSKETLNEKDIKKRDIRFSDGWVKGMKRTESYFGGSLGLLR